MAVINPPRLGLGWTLLAVIAIAAASSGEGVLSASLGRVERAVPVKDIQSHNRQLASVDTNDLINLDLIGLVEEGEEEDKTSLLLRVFLGESNATAANQTPPSAPPTDAPTGPPTMGEPSKPPTTPPPSAESEEPCPDVMGTHHCKNLIEDNPKICPENMAVRVQKCRRSCNACNEVDPFPPSPAATPAPTPKPTRLPTGAPSISPTKSPSATPTKSPSFAPSATPTNSPSIAPSAANQTSSGNHTEVTSKKQERRKSTRKRKRKRELSVMESEGKATVMSDLELLDMSLMEAAHLGACSDKWPKDCVSLKTSGQCASAVARYHCRKSCNACDEKFNFVMPAERPANVTHEVDVQMEDLELLDTSLLEANGLDACADDPAWAKDCKTLKGLGQCPTSKVCRMHCRATCGSCDETFDFTMPQSKAPTKPNATKVA